MTREEFLQAAGYVHYTAGDQDTWYGPDGRAMRRSEDDGSVEQQLDAIAAAGIASSGSGYGTTGYVNAPVDARAYSNSQNSDLVERNGQQYQRIGGDLSIFDNSWAPPGLRQNVIADPTYGNLLPMADYQRLIAPIQAMSAADDRATTMQWLSGALGFAGPALSAAGAFSGLGLAGGQGFGAAGGAFPMGAEGAAFGGGMGETLGSLGGAFDPTQFADLGTGLTEAGPQATMTDSTIFDTLTPGGGGDVNMTGFSNNPVASLPSGGLPSWTTPAMAGGGALATLAGLGGGGDGSEAGTFGTIPMSQAVPGLPSGFQVPMNAGGNFDPTLLGGLNPGGGLTPTGVTPVPSILQRLAQLLNPGGTQAGTNGGLDWTRLLGTLGATGLGMLGANDQTNSIRDANATNAAAFAAAQQRAMATLTAAQQQALQSSGAGRDAAIAAYNSSLTRALSTNEAALNTANQTFGDTRDASLAQSNTARNNAMGVLDTARSGALGANQATQDQYFGLGDQYRDLLEASYNPNFRASSIAGYDDAVNSSMNSALRGLSTQGNPFDNPGGLMEANRYVTQNTALPAIQNYRAQLGQFGNQGLDTAGQAANQRPNIYGQFGQAQSNVLQNFGQFDANLNTQAGNNIANANLQAGQFNTNLINQSGNNVANTWQQTGQNDANLIGRLGQTGAQVLGSSYNSVPSSNAGMFNALGYGLNQVANPQPDLATLLRQLQSGAATGAAGGGW